MQWVPAYRAAISFSTMSFIGTASGGGSGRVGGGVSGGVNKGTGSATATVSRIRDMDFNANAVYDSIQANNNSRFNKLI